MSPKIKWLAWGVVIILLVYTRFINLSWGLPFPFHPDERNLANAIQSLSCDLGSTLYDVRSCFNPNFFAYGQLPIYTGYLLIFLGRLITRVTGVIQFDEAVMALRFISATASLATVYFSLEIIKRLLDHELRITNSKPFILFSAFLILTFSPAQIQFAHFGTTESLLMLFFTWLIHLCLRLDEKRASKDVDSIYIWVGVVVGVAIATKVSALIFAIVPTLTIASLSIRKAHKSWYQAFWQCFNELVFVGFITGTTAILFSPYNFISWKEFTASIDYESMVATGKTLVFYTRTFSESVPVLFQFQRIFPYALGWPVFVLFLAGFVFLPWKRSFNLLRVAFLIYFLPTAFLFTKWTRFMAPVVPLMITIASLFIGNLYGSLKLKIQKSKIQVKNQNFLLLGCNFTFFLLTLALILPGIIFLKVYATQDVRFQASEWMAKNIPNNSYILQETANVVDLPLYLEPWSAERRTFRNVSFNFYELDNEKKLQKELEAHLKKADYIIIPSRRIFKNHSKAIYPVLNKYYEDLFSGKLGFKQVAEFKVLDDEDSEETWTVFDHPKIRIYGKSTTSF